jgi:hypothetical protein
MSDEREFAEHVVRRVRDALDMDEDETLEIKTPQFDRRDGVEPEEPPLTEEEFDQLRELSTEELSELGLRKWDESGLMLFPHEWYPHIPDGVTVTDINGETYEFDRTCASDDKRFGVLAYGIVPDYERDADTTEDDGGRAVVARDDDDAQEDGDGV